MPSRPNLTTSKDQTSYTTPPGLTLDIGSRHRYGPLNYRLRGDFGVSRRVGLAIAAATGVLIASSLPAVASPTSDATPGAATLSSGFPSTVKFTNAALSASPNAVGVITCTIKAGYPHASTHVNGTINTVGTLSCTSAVRSLSITHVLYRGSTEEGRAPGSNKGVASISKNVAVSCALGPATFQSQAGGGIIPPVGFVPTSGQVFNSSPEIYLACGAPPLVSRS